jgi:alpha-1,2-mannosyltransferase
MLTKRWLGFFLLLCVSIYVLFFYEYLSHPYPIDFSCFYSSRLALAFGENPYNNFIPSYIIAAVKKIPANLNPPIFLWLFTPLIHFSYKLAFIIWSVISVLLGFLSLRLIIKLINPKNAPWLYYLIYFSCFGVFANTAVGQLGALLLFLIVFGYYYFGKQRCYLAGFFWGAAIALKFFPGLLIIHALIKRRYHVVASMLSTAFALSIIPGLFYGKVIYKQYFAMLAKVSWYGDGWNWSLYAYILRLFMDTQGRLSHHYVVLAIWVILAAILLVWYVKKLLSYDESCDNHQAINLTIMLMAILSPMFWLYYFPLLVFPLLTTWGAMMYGRNLLIVKKTVCWFTALFTLNLPFFTNLRAQDLTNMLFKLGFPSFYGMLLLLCLVTDLKLPQEGSSKYAAITTQATFLILSFSMFVSLQHFITGL